jgi:hypothetical protein
MIAWGDLTLEACLREDTLNFLKGSNFYAEEISAARGLAPFQSALVTPLVLAAAVPSFVRIDRHDKSISNKTLQYRPGDPMLLFSL